MITYQQEFLSKIRQDIEPLLKKHWKEVALHKDKIKLEPHWDGYEAMEQLNVLRVFTARQGPKLVGYFAVSVAPSLHYASHTFAISDVIYVDPDSRHSGVASKLIEFAEGCLKKDGVSVVHINTKAHKPFEPLLVGLGYEKIDLLYGKYLGD